MRYLNKGGVGAKPLPKRRVLPPSLGHFRAYLKIVNRHFPKIYPLMLTTLRDV